MKGKMKKNFRKNKLLKKIIKKIKKPYNLVKQACQSEKALKQFIRRDILRPIRHFFGIGLIKHWNFPLDIVFENEDFILINKPAKILTHPTKKNEAQTLLNALLFHLIKTRGLKNNYFKKNKLPGPISRLDKDTSGIVLFAISDTSRSQLGKRMMKHGFSKKYQCLVQGKVSEPGEITVPLVKDPNHATRMKVLHTSHLHSEDMKIKESHTLYAPLQYFPEENVTLLAVQILTGRMHQIRVHMQSIQHPIIGDILYGKKDINIHFFDQYKLDRQFLHAVEFSWDDNIFQAPLTEDLQYVLKKLT